MSHHVAVSNLLLCSLAVAQSVTLTEILPGANSEIEFRNSTGAGVMASDYTVCVLAPGGLTQYCQLPGGITLPAGHVVRLKLGVAGSSSASTIYLPNCPAVGGGGGEVIIYNGGLPVPLQMNSYVSWGGSQVHIAEAVSVGKWSSLTSSAPFPVPLGSSLAYDGTGVSGADWELDSTPTLGLENQLANAYVFGVGCMGSNGVPQLTLTGRPWLGATVVATASNIAPPGVGAFILGFSQLPGVSLAPLGMPGCFSYVSLDVLIGSAVGATISTQVAIPGGPQLVGSEVFVQAVVVDLPANAAGLVATGAGLLSIGQN